MRLPRREDDLEEELRCRADDADFGARERADDAGLDARFIDPWRFPLRDREDELGVERDRTDRGDFCTVALCFVEERVLVGVFTEARELFDLGAERVRAGGEALGVRFVRELGGETLDRFGTSALTGALRCEVFARDGGLVFIDLPRTDCAGPALLGVIRFGDVGRDELLGRCVAGRAGDALGVRPDSVSELRTMGLRADFEVLAADLGFKAFTVLERSFDTDGAALGVRCLLGVSGFISRPSRSKVRRRDDPDSLLPRMVCELADRDLG